MIFTDSSWSIYSLGQTTIISVCIRFECCAGFFVWHIYQRHISISDLSRYTTRCSSGSHVGNMDRTGCQRYARITRIHIFLLGYVESNTRSRILTRILALAECSDTGSEFSDMLEYSVNRILGYFFVARRIMKQKSLRKRRIYSDVKSRIHAALCWLRYLLSTSF